MTGLILEQWCGRNEGWGGMSGLILERVGVEEECGMSPLL